jgi:hypothetical protein
LLARSALNPHRPLWGLHINVRLYLDFDNFFAFYMMKMRFVDFVVFVKFRVFVVLVEFMKFAVFMMLAFVHSHLV